MNISLIIRFIVIVLVMNFVLNIAFQYPIVYLLLIAGFFIYRYLRRNVLVNRMKESMNFQNQQQAWNSTEDNYNSWNEGTKTESHSGSGDVFEAEYVEREVE